MACADRTFEKYAQCECRVRELGDTFQTSSPQIVFLRHNIRVATGDRSSPALPPKRKPCHLHVRRTQQNSTQAKSLNDIFWRVRAHNNFQWSSRAMFES